MRRANDLGYTVVGYLRDFIDLRFGESGVGGKDCEGGVAERVCCRETSALGISCARDD